MMPKKTGGAGHVIPYNLVMYNVLNLGRPYTMIVTTHFGTGAIALLECHN